MSLAPAGATRRGGATALLLAAAGDVRAIGVRGVGSAAGGVSMLLMVGSARAARTIQPIARNVFLALDPAGAPASLAGAGAVAVLPPCWQPQRHVVTRGGTRRAHDGQSHA
jgi:hypothetical protein